ncbi:MAG: hypothetical protein NTX22_13430 [Ignavibacteriales bacterium]|nr:hypothetical protein [Ignavibacteriales bacterium]
MGICKYCNKSAGFLIKKHPECENLHVEGLNNIIQLILAFLKNDNSLESLEPRLLIIEENSFINVKESFEQIILSLKIRIDELVNYNSISDLEAEKIKLLRLFLLNRYKNHINDELSNLSFMDNQIIFIGAKKFKVKHATDSYLYARDEEKGNSRMFRMRDDLEFLLLKYAGSLSNDLKEMLKNKAIYFGYESIKSNTDPDLLKMNLLNKLLKYDFNEDSLKSTILEAIELYIENSLDETLIDKKKEDYIFVLKKYFALEQNEINRNGIYLKLIKSLIIRDVLEGLLPKRCNVTNQIPFIIQNNETLIWIENNVNYYEDKEHREYVGSHQGFSIRIASGLYYRAGGFKGKPINTISKEYVSTGILGFTTKHVYFYSSINSFRIKYAKIVSIMPNSDGFTIIKEGIRSKTQTFKNGDGWFAYNLMVNLSQKDLKLV